MPNQPTDSTQLTANTNDPAEERRKLWIVTGYGLCFLALAGVMAFLASNFLAH